MKMGKSNAYMPKRAITAFLLLAVAFPSLAEPPTLDDCSLYSRYAEAVMEARQNNADIADIVAAANGAPDDWQRRMITQAYDEPRFETPENRVNAVRDFKNRWYLACMKQAANK